MTTLNLFPARIRFVNEDGTLTPEAFRALQIVFARVGGALGDSGTDVFGQVFGVANETGNLSALLADVVQPLNFGSDYYDDVVQYQLSSKGFTDVVYPDITQPLSREPGNFTTIDTSGNAVIGGTLRLAAGTVGLPSLYWSTDRTTGFYRIGANNIGFSVSGVKVLDLLSTGLTVVGALAASGWQTFTNGTQVTVTTSSAYTRLTSTGGDFFVATDSSAGTSFAAGGAAYAANYYLSGAYPHIWSISGLERMRLASTGLTVGGTITTTGGATFHTTSTALTNGAAAAAGTLLNAPVAGNPTKWIGINDNGTTRYIPAW